MGFSAEITTSSRGSSFCPRYFCFSNSFRFRNFQSSRSFSAFSKKAFDRRGDNCKIQDVNAPIFSVALSNDPLMFREKSHRITMQQSDGQSYKDNKYSYPNVLVEARPKDPAPYNPNYPRSLNSSKEYAFSSSNVKQPPMQTWDQVTLELKNTKRVACKKSSTEDAKASAEKGIVKTNGAQTELRAPTDRSAYERLVIPKEFPKVKLVDINKAQPHKELPMQEDKKFKKINLQAKSSRLPTEDHVSAYPSTDNGWHNRALQSKKSEQATGAESLAFDTVNGTHKKQVSDEGKGCNQKEQREKIGEFYEKVLVVDNISSAKEVVHMLTNEYRHLVYACDTEVSMIDVKRETPVDHGEIVCFSISPQTEVNFGNGKTCIWVDVLDGGGKNLLAEFAPFFEDSSIKKVWHNYSFDKHVIENYGIKVHGFHADTMHMARLWNSSRRTEGGYSLEALTGDSSVMSDAKLAPGEVLTGKVSMKTLFGRKKVKSDGSEGKAVNIPAVEELQRVDRKLWICYSALDSITTIRLYESLENKLSKVPWIVDGVDRGSMLSFYQKYWRPFGELLVKMEAEGMLVDRAYLAEIEKLAKSEQQVAVARFRSWACKYCDEAKYMNVGSDQQLRVLFFGGIQNSKDPNEYLPTEKMFTIPNVDNIIEEGKKAPLKFRKITLQRIGDEIMKTDMYTASGWPSVSGDALKTMAGKVSADFEFVEGATQLQLAETFEELSVQKIHEEDSESSNSASVENIDVSAYGTAYKAFGEGKSGIEACHAIAALCEVCSIDSLISNFILPLQGSDISGKNGRIHCSLNINTETGRLSARRPNLQNQPALEKDRYKIRQAFIAAPGNSLIVADYGQLELRILAHLANCKSMLDAFKAGGDFHSRTAMNMYPYIREAIEQNRVLLEWHPQPGEDKPPVPLLKDAFASERRKAKMLNFSIAYGKTAIGLSRDWKVSVKEAQETVDRWYSDRKEVLKWQEKRKAEARKDRRVHTLLGRARHFPSLKNATAMHKNHIERAAINTPVQGSAADVAMCAMLEISRNAHLKKLGWKLLLQVHDEVILEGPTESAEEAKAIVVECMSNPFDGKNILRVDLSVDAKCAQNWYAAK